MLKGVKLNSLSKYLNLFWSLSNIFFHHKDLVLNGAKMWQSKFVYRGANQWFISHLMPIFNFKSLKLSSVYCLRRKNKGSNFSTGPLYLSIVGTVKIENYAVPSRMVWRYYRLVVGIISIVPTLEPYWKYSCDFGFLYVIIPIEVLKYFRKVFQSNDGLIYWKFPTNSFQLRIIEQKVQFY